jgi:REP element-mobilizing transposase RayT
MAGILKRYESPCLAVNGTANDVHILILQSKNVALSSLIGELKKSSSIWIKTKGSSFRRFHWQDGYGAFSIGESGVAAVKEYMARQKEKHKKRSFEEEFIALLKKYKVAYEERYVWD